MLFSHGLLGLWDWNADHCLFVPEATVLNTKADLGDVLAMIDELSMGCSVPIEKKYRREFLGEFFDAQPKVVPATNPLRDAIERWYPSKLVLMVSDNACATCPFSLMCMAQEPLGCKVETIIEGDWQTERPAPMSVGPTFFPFVCPRCHCFFFTMKTHVFNTPMTRQIRQILANSRKGWPYEDVLYCCPHLREGKWERELDTPIRFPRPKRAETHVVLALFGSNANASPYTPHVACAHQFAIKSVAHESTVRDHWQTKYKFNPEHPFNVMHEAVRPSNIEVSSADCVTWACDHHAAQGTLLASDPWKHIEIEIR